MNFRHVMQTFDAALLFTLGADRPEGYCHPNGVCLSVCPSVHKNFNIELFSVTIEPIAIIFGRMIYHDDHYTKPPRSSHSIGFSHLSEHFSKNFVIDFSPLILMVDGSYVVG